MKCPFSFISLKKLFKSLSTLFSLFTFSVGMKFKLLLKSLYSLFEKEYIAQLTTFPSRSGLYLIETLTFLRNLTRFSLYLRWMKLHSKQNKQTTTVLFAVHKWRKLKKETKYGIIRIKYFKNLCSLLINGITKNVTLTKFGLVLGQTSWISIQSFFQICTYKWRIQI